MIRSEQNYDNQHCGDLYGNRATQAWNPRACPKGYTFQKRVYGAHRLKGPVTRKGWKELSDAGGPSLADEPALRSRDRCDAVDSKLHGAVNLFPVANGVVQIGVMQRDGFSPRLLVCLEHVSTFLRNDFPAF